MVSTALVNANSVYVPQLRGFSPLNSSNYTPPVFQPPSRVIDLQGASNSTLDRMRHVVNGVIDCLSGSYHLVADFFPITPEHSFGTKVLIGGIAGGIGGAIGGGAVLKTVSYMQKHPSSKVTDMLLPIFGVIMNILEKLGITALYDKFFGQA